MNTQLVDLHVHTDCSDGYYSAGQVVEIAVKYGLSAVAITDHDTLEGIEEACRAGAECGLEIVPGVEISAWYNEAEIHLLGYYPQHSERLQEELLAMRRDRERRMQIMLENLRRLGMAVDDEELREETGEAAPGRLHLARLMVKKKFARDLNDAFTRYLDIGKPAYVPRRKLTVKSALSLLMEAKAVTALAHPGKSGLSVLKELSACGLQGVEVYHPDHSPRQQALYRRLAAQYNLLVTGGSDFHGGPNARITRPGAVAVPYSCLELLKKYRR